MFSTIGATYKKMAGAVQKGVAYAKGPGAAHASQWRLAIEKQIGAGGTLRNMGESIEGIAQRAGAGGIISNMMGMGTGIGLGAGTIAPQTYRAIRGGMRGIGKAFQAQPVLTGAALGLAMGTTGAALSLGTRTLSQMSNQMRPSGGIGPAMASRGYVSWTNGRSEGMSAEHLGASGGLPLALHRVRHRLNMHRAGFS
jgi:hypothetical protein